jgi:hypothetical protein
LDAVVEFAVREIFIDIYKLDPDRELITSIEVLSPSNKRRGGGGWAQYERKRNLFVQGHANLVEIDLLRRGRRHAMSGPWPKSPYVISVFRREKAPTAEIWPAFCIKPLPTIPIPLLPHDSDVAVALQPLVSDIYAVSRYFDDMNYGEPIRPPLAQEEAKLLTDFLSTKKRDDS